MSTRNFFIVEKATSCLFSRVRVKQHFPIESPISLIFMKSIFRLEAETLVLFATEKREVSSANSLTAVVRPRGRSLM